MFVQVLDEVVQELAGPRLLDHLIDLDELGCSHTLADAEARLQAKVRLYGSLIEEGWSPPAGVLAQLERDQALLTVSGRYAGR